MNPDPFELGLLLRVLYAALLGAALGWEREAAGKSAGLRTHILVALTTALFVASAELAIRHLGATAAPGSVRFDPIRLVQAVSIGVGFLGGGIIRVSEGRTHGVTTAASIWATAAVGLAAGLAQWWLAAGGALLILLVLRVLMRFDTNRERA